MKVLVGARVGGGSGVLVLVAVAAGVSVGAVVDSCAGV
jgi:hypothetical protein